MRTVDARGFAKARIKESFYQKAIAKVTMRKKIKTWNHCWRKTVPIVGYQVLEHKINVKEPLFQIVRIIPIKLILEKQELQ
jgi:hypothetical protein